MRIGITYDLRQEYLAQGFGDEETAEFDRPDTIDAIDNALKALGHETDRIGHVKNLVARLASNDAWDLVFNIAEGMHGIGREAQVPAILDAYAIPYTFSDPLVLCLTMHKGMAKRVIRDIGIPTPDFFVVESPGDADSTGMDFPLFIKPVSEGTGKGITPSSVVRSMKELQEGCKNLLDLYQQPVIVETFLPGREFTVGIVGTGADARSVGIVEIILNKKAETGVYSYYNKEFCEELVEYRPVDDDQALKAVDTALWAWRGLSCRDAGRIDVRCDRKGIPNFIEANPLAGLHPEHSDLPIICSHYGIGYQELIASILDSAMARVRASGKAKTGSPV